MRVLFPFHVESVEARDAAINMIKGSYVGPLGETGIADYEVFWYGPWLSERPEDVNRLLFNACMQYEPNIIFFINGWYPWYHNRSRQFVKLSTLYLIRRIFGSRITFLWTDLAPSTFRMIDDVSYFCDISLTHEHPSSVVGVHDHKKYTTVPTVYSPALFHGSPVSERKYDVVFLGAIRDYADREEGIKRIQESGIDILVRDSHEGYLSWEDYAQIVKDAKIVVNWTKFKHGGWHQAKGRIFETTLAGSLLISEKCDAVDYWLTPLEHYVPFKTNEQLVDMLHYYLSNNLERIKIASSGHKKAMAEYTAETYFKNIISYVTSSGLYNEAQAVRALHDNAFHGELQNSRELLGEFSTQLVGHEMEFRAVVEILEAANTSSYQRFRRLVVVLYHVCLRRDFLFTIARILLPKSFRRKSIIAMIDRIKMFF